MPYSWGIACFKASHTCYPNYITLGIKPNKKKTRSERARESRKLLHYSGCMCLVGGQVERAGGLCGDWAVASAEGDATTKHKFQWNKLIYAAARAVSWQPAASTEQNRTKAKAKAKQKQWQSQRPRPEQERPRTIHLARVCAAAAHMPYFSQIYIHISIYIRYIPTTHYSYSHLSNDALNVDVPHAKSKITLQKNTDERKV